MLVRDRSAHGSGAYADFLEKLARRGFGRRLARIDLPAR